MPKENSCSTRVTMKGWTCNILKNDEQLIDCVCIEDWQVWSTHITIIICARKPRHAASILFAFIWLCVCPSAAYSEILTLKKEIKNWNPINRISISPADHNFHKHTFCSTRNQCIAMNTFAQRYLRLWALCTPHKAICFIGVWIKFFLFIYSVVYTTRIL